MTWFGACFGSWFCGLVWNFGLGFVFYIVLFRTVCLLFVLCFSLFRWWFCDCLLLSWCGRISDFFCLVVWFVVDVVSCVFDLRFCDCVEVGSVLLVDLCLL